MIMIMIMIIVLHVIQEVNVWFLFVCMDNVVTVFAVAPGNVDVN